MTCSVQTIGGKRVVCFDAPTPPPVEAGYRIDSYIVERERYSQEFKTLDEAAAAYGDQGPEHAELAVFALPDPEDGDKPGRMAEWSNSKGAWGKWQDN